jgi:hypothetical protein
MPSALLVVDGFIPMHAETAAAYLDLRQQVSQGSNGGGLASATIAHDHDATDLWVNHVQDQSQLHLLLANNGGEGEDGASRACMKTKATSMSKLHTMISA